MTMPITIVDSKDQAKTSVELIFISCGPGIVSQVAQALLASATGSNGIQTGETVTVKMGSELVRIQVFDEKRLPTKPLNTRPAIVLLEGNGLPDAITTVKMRMSENLMCHLSVEDAAQLLHVKLNSSDNFRDFDIRLLPGSAACLSISAQTMLTPETVARVMIKSVDILSRRMDIARQIVAEAQMRDNR